MSLSRYANSTIGQKQIMAVTGLLLVGFLISHLSGNFLIFAGTGDFEPENLKAMQNNVQSSPEQKASPLGKHISTLNADTDLIPLNKYAHGLRSLGPLLWIARIGLIVIFCLHLILFLKLTAANKKARPVSYAKDCNAGGKTISSTTMKYTGIVLFFYVAAHLIDFTFQLTGYKYELNGVDHGLYGYIVNAFKNPIHSLGYIAVMICMGLHLSHALQSACQTFGINHPIYTPLIKKASVGIAVIIAAGYISIPVYVLTCLS